MFFKLDTSGGGRWLPSQETRRCPMAGKILTQKRIEAMKLGEELADAGATLSCTHAEYAGVIR